MNPFQYVRPVKARSAIDLLANDRQAMLVAGGTNLLDLMKRGVLTPEKLVDINKLPWQQIEKTATGIRLGALTRNSDVACHPLVLEKHPLLAQALLAGASAQVRNMATTGGNILQRTRCYYYYDTAFPCNKRTPGAGCSALEGYNRIHAIFGFSDQCIAVHPSDMCIALTALEASVLVAGPRGERRIPFGDFHRLPGSQPNRDTVLEPQELILALDLPDGPFTKNVHYLKVRDRASFAFALVSVAAALDIDSNTIRHARLVMGGVAHKPWRLFAAEKALTGQPVSETSFREAAAVAMQDAKAFEHNAYKLKMAPNAIVEALKTAAGLI
jgi:xanthine dehydrogenase YagS FAD-binding subunit